MKYIVYTDAAASTEKRMSGCGYIIHTDKTFISSDSIRVVHTYNPTHAEVVSIGLAAADLIDKSNLSKDDVVEIHTDCLSAIEFCNNHIYQDGPICCGSKVVKNSIMVLRQLAKKCKVELSKVHGHKNSHNPNTVVDRLAKLPVRRD